MSIDATPYPLYNSSVQQKGDMEKIDHFKSKKLNVHVRVHQSKKFPFTDYHIFKSAFCVLT